MRKAVALAVLLLFGSTGAIQYKSRLGQDFGPTPTCSMPMCANWKLGAWLPVLMDGIDPWRRHQATPVRFSDRFAGGSATDPLGGANGGTGFVYGNAGVKGEAIYDYAHHLALYSQGCCSWGTRVLASQAPPPPIHVVDNNLASVRTVRGIALGESSGHVRAVYGNAPFNSVPGYPGLTMLSYYHMFNRYCSQFQNFAFQRDRVVYIELLFSC